MIITKMSVPRRTFLRGAGVTLALPLLDAMVPALSAMAKTAAKATPRLGFFYVPNGITMAHWHVKGVGPAFDFSPILSPLESFRDQLVVVRDLANAQGDPDPTEANNGPHTRTHSAWLSGVRPKRTEGADIQSGITIDQVAAKELGKDTQLLSLELATEPAYYNAGNCDNGYSCVYQSTFSWRTPTMPLPMEPNPRVVFERLFGDGGSAATQLKRMQQDRSILDWVTEDMARLQKKLGLQDRTRLSGYLEAVRDVELRIEKGEKQINSVGESAMPVLEKPLGIPASDDEHFKLMFDLLLLAYQADITRVSTFQIAREQSGRTYPQVGVENAHHEISHHQGRPERMALNSKVNTYHVSHFARFLDNMRNTPDGDGSLLDHAIMVYGAGMGDGDFHSPHDLPIVLVGGGCGQLRGGRHLKPAVDTPMMNLGLSLLDKVGVERASIGDSTGRLVGL